ncbi:NADH:flavin oxidoreductase [Sphingomonas koreensis]|jgi:2,4-dienoyl-CoA reductase (NADPH2)|uniref:NADH:flavin oxidoreductase n=1 Tax=Sphingomonas koreensis TaxID=93064 RepID=A0A1L6J554_9SPHN|nr:MULTISPECIES: FAD-dependent oxidoreductase [Sphingomonas]APR51083.1 NADH:flavin oxidoreductase [Sphingomonas koreensis]MCR5870977.1 NAD(P)/FAD-dependent oxidoreductase [Sphingomonas sp. J344]MDC7810631.1 FAD-dependent oxidoreductase [Sphingomonas koreensis]PJI89539.1 2,4-dienoyl-CoA reductase-like NADH-dependent reductase (Old Yellow Enzyme family) [Sphingomonas koreensis]RSU17686.1 NADH:flavin oxidoreductase [Sphingomonas koreensis]
MTGSTAYPNLFTPLRLRGVELPNRLVMAPMSTELGGLEGEVTPAMIAFYRERALGGMGLIIVEYTCVDPDTGRAHEYQLTLDDRKNLDGHRRLVRTIHDAGAKIFMQIQHCGQYANRKVLPGGMPVGPSDIFSKRDPEQMTCRGLTSEEIAKLVISFGNTAALAVEAGYDGVELHGAHGYLLTQFMSPLGNKRDDEWGGDAERRLAFPLAVIRSVREKLGELPLVYRLSADEFRPGGLTIDDMEEIAPRLVEAGADALHVSMGWGVGPAFEKVVEPMSMPEGWRIPYAARIRAATGVPVIAVGQIRWPETGEQAVASGDADLIALGRPMLTDPEWANKAKAGRRDLIRPCTSCNWCISPHPGRVQVGCAENPRTGTELDPPIPVDMGKGKRAVVIGAGPGGASAALLLQQSGFETHIFETRAFTGGGIIASATPPGKDKLFWYSDYLGNRLAESAVIRHFGKRAELEDILALNPDVAILAAGTRRIDLPIEGLDDPIVMDAYDLLMRERDLGLTEGQHAIVYGGGETGCETAEFCAHHGVHVTLVSRSPADKLARSAEWVYRMGLLRRLHENPLITIVDNSHVRSVGNRKVTIETGGVAREIEADRLLLAQGRRSADELAAALGDAGIAVSVVGDSRQVGRIGDAVHMSYRAVQALSAQYARMPKLAC